MNIDKNQEVETQKTTDCNPPETRNQHPDRIKISPEALSRLSIWNDEATSRLRGVKLTRSDLVNFLILNHEQALSQAELKALENQFFDEVKFAQWAVDELKAAKGRGESIRLAEIIARNRSSLPAKAPRKARSRSSDPGASPTTNEE